MTNAEKYKDLILNSNLLCDDFVKPFVLKKYGFKCGDISCSKCYAATTIFLNEEYQEPETDWSKVQVDTPILVCDNEEDGWIEAHFAKCENDMVYAWDDGRTSYTSRKSDCSYFEHAKLAEDNPT